MDEFLNREVGPGGLEFRTLLRPAGELRAADDDGPVIEGFGSVSEQTTTIEGVFADWDEEVAAGAWEATIKSGDIRSMKNHDTNFLLGRTKSGSLRLEERDEGLFFSVDVNPGDPNAMSTHAQVARGDIDGASVWFRVLKQEIEVPSEDNDLERPKRRILEAQLFETGPVVFPAFEQTSVTARSLRPLDAALRVAGISDRKRARLASDFVADPESVEAELRHLFARAPDLRDAVCACKTSGRAADPAPPQGAAESAPAPAATALSVARARLTLQGRRTTAA